MMWMSMLSAIVFLLSLITSEVAVATESEEERVVRLPKTKPITECVKTGPCSCKTSEGSIDLSPLAYHNLTARYKDVPDTQGANIYSWNPCRPFTESAHCENVAACKLEIDFSSAEPIGTQDSAQFVVTPLGDLSLQYTYPDPSGVNRTTIVTLTCAPYGGDSAISVYGEMTAFHYTLGLLSPYACVRKN